MPSLPLAIVTFLIVLIICAGALSYPLIRMLFGVHDNVNKSIRGKFLLTLIWLFPVVAIASLYGAWASNAYISLAPFVYIVFVWSIRANKGGSIISTGATTTKGDILQARLEEIESRWPSWQKIKARKKYILLKLIAPNVDVAEDFKRLIATTENLYQEVDWVENQGGGLTLTLSIMFDRMDKNMLVVLVMRVIDISWGNSCKLLSVDIVESRES